MKYFKLLGIAIAGVLLLTACSYGMGEDVPSVTSQDQSSQPQSSEIISVPQPQQPEPDSYTVPDISSKGEVAVPNNTDDWRLLLVNRQSPLPEDFHVELEAAITTADFNYRFDARAADALRNFMNAAKKDGVSLAVISTYRKQSTQERLYASKVAEYVNAGYSSADAKNEAARWVAVPGTSEHQTGLAVDVVSADWYSYNDDLYDTFENTSEFEWLVAHCVEYGFVLRYAKDKQEITGITYEPWHYRYVGVEHARYMTENNLCLEEYIQHIGS